MRTCELLRAAVIAGCGNCGPMQSAGSMYLSIGGRALHYSTGCNFTCKLYMMLSDVHLRAYKYVGLTLNCALRALFYVWCGLADCSYCGPLRAEDIAGQCKVRLLSISVLEGFTLHNLMHFYMQTSSDAMLSELAGLRLYTVHHVDLRA